MNKLFVGILQDEFTVNPMDNYEKIKKVLEEKHEVADIIIVPEYSMINILTGLKPKDVYEKAERLEDSTYISKISDLAARIDAYILMHFIEKTDMPPKTMSTSILVHPTGRISKVYSKMHLFDAYGYRESDYFLPGTSLSKTLVINGNGMKFYVAICYDLRFPELFRSYARMDAYGVFVHAGWVKGPLKEEILDLLARARSHENTMYIILSDQTGKQYVGRSGVFSPYGFREVDMGYKRGYIEWPINPVDVLEARKIVPVVNQSKNRWDIILKK